MMYNEDERCLNCDETRTGGKLFYNIPYLNKDGFYEAVHYCQQCVYLPYEQYLEEYNLTEEELSLRQYLETLEEF